MQGFLHFLVPIITRTYKIVSILFYRYSILANILTGLDLRTVKFADSEVIATLDHTHLDILSVRLAKHHRQLNGSVVV